VMRRLKPALLYAICCMSPFHVSIPNSLQASNLAVSYRKTSSFRATDRDV
jgi:hypothetical protein